MNKAIFKKTCLSSILCIVMMTFALYVPLTCDGAEYSMGVDFSPNIINIESARLGEIRVFTNLRYSAFVANGDSIFLYFNGSNNSVPDIRATRDSLGNLILRFGIEDLLVVEEDLMVDASNNVLVVVVMTNGDEYLGIDDDVYILDKKAH